MILAIIVIGLIIIFWLQFPFIKEDNSTTESKNKTIFNKVKIPIVFLCIVFIIYLLSNKPCVSESKINSLEIDNSPF
jgi:hypothetical protein